MTNPSTAFCDCSNSNTIAFNNVVQCRSCCDTSNCVSYNSEFVKKQIEKRIQNQVGVSESQMMDVKSSITIGNELMKNPRVYTKSQNYPFRNLSDRSEASIQNNGGRGVDVKHGSYARYLGKLKAPIISHAKTTAITPPNVHGSRTRPVVNNKQFRFCIVATNDNCVCPE